jgi:flagellar basal body-associated protein FliL
MKNCFLILIFILTLAVTFHSSSYAQCALCKSSAESSLKEGDTQAQGLNMGIMYLLVMPYLLVGGIGYYWYVNQKKQQQESEEEEI